MRIFLSHATHDVAVARYLKARISGSFGVGVFLVPDDTTAGASWMNQIQDALHQCEEVVSLITPQAQSRPWMAAEWACFWMQKKPCTPLLLGVGIGDLWEPMRAYQGADLTDPRQVAWYLNQVASKTGQQPTEGVVPISHELVGEIKAIQHRVALASAEEVMSRMTGRLQAGAANVNGADITVLVNAGRLNDLMELALSDSTGNVKRRQVASQLIRIGRLGEALRLAVAIENRQEAKNCAEVLVREMSPLVGPESQEWVFLDGIYAHLRDPQRRDLYRLMLNRGLVPLGKWATYVDTAE